MSRSVILPVLVVLFSGCVRYMDSKQQGGDQGGDLSSPDDVGHVADKGPDLLPTPDVLAPDQLLVPDAGCPNGMTQCGSICANLTVDLLNCGACGKVCSKGANACLSGTCICGSDSGPCPEGLNCINGSCLCLQGGLCTGCCEGTAKCVSPTGQTAKQCGAAGAACKSCDDGNVCTADECSQGTCDNRSGLANGLPCDDGISCTNDQCSKGVCVGAPLTGYCVVDNTCHVDGVYKTAAKCQQCLSLTSNTAWVDHPNPGCVTTFAGTGYKGHVDGPAASAKFKDPRSVVVDASGVVYVADQGNNCIRKIENGQVTSIGSCVWGYLDGPSTTAQFASPTGLALGGNDTLYVADSGNHRIRTITLTTYTVGTLAGSGTDGHLDGPTASAQFKSPYGLDVVANGTVYVADRGNQVIRWINTSSVTTLAGTPGVVGSTNGALAVATFAYPSDLAMDAGDVYIADKGTGLIRRISGNNVSTFAGSGQGYQDGPAATAKFQFPYGLGLDKGGPSLTILVADGGNHRIRAVTGGNVTTLVGSGVAGFSNGPALAAQLDSPQDVATDAAGKVYIVDQGNQRIRLYTP